MLAERIMREPPEVGCLTVSTMLLWKLRYGRAIDIAGSVEGVENLLPDDIAE